MTELKVTGPIGRISDDRAKYLHFSAERAIHYELQNVGIEPQDLLWLLEDRADLAALRAENQILREASQEALHYLECHADVDAQLFCTKQLRAALAENPIEQTEPQT